MNNELTPGGIASLTLRPPAKVQDVCVPTENGTGPVDVGKALGLVLYDDDIKYGGGKRHQRFSPKLSPDMTTYCIKHTHRMTWEVRVTELDSGKSHRVQVSPAVGIEGPSRQTMEQAIADLTEEGKRARFKAVMKGAGLGLEGLNAIAEIVQAFS